MSALCKPYDTPEDADRAVTALLEAGVPGDGVRVLMGAAMHDARRERTGTFAGARATDDVVGSFAGDRPAATVRGAFASAGPGGPEGTFGSADRDVVVSYADGAERARVAGHHLLKGLLMDAGLDDVTAEADVRALHDGRVLVLVDLAAIEAGRARALLDDAVATPAA